jgi:hypothetical protein
MDKEVENDTSKTNNSNGWKQDYPVLQ